MTMVATHSPGSIEGRAVETDNGHHALPGGGLVMNPAGRERGCGGWFRGLSDISHCKYRYGLEDVISSTPAAMCAIFLNMFT